jgi:hypothetical protein
MEHLEQGRVDDQGLRFAHQFAQDGAPQRLQEAPELAHSTVQGGGMKADDPGEQVREEAGDFAQEGALGLHPSQLLKEREGEDLRVRELLEGGVASSSRVEPVVDVVYAAEQDGESLFQEGQLWGML